MKILITGGAGFVGGHLAHKYLGEGHDVHLLENFDRAVQDTFLDGLLQDGAKILKIDLLDEDAIKQVSDDYDMIFHFAAIIGVKQVSERPYNVLVDNVRMTENTIKIAKTQKNLTRLVFSSTSEVYAGTLKHFELPLPTPETTAIALTDLNQARTTYMLSKLFGEAMFNFSTLPITNVRLHNVYGPRMGMSHVIPELLFKAYNKPKKLEVASIDHKRTFCYIADAVTMLAKLAEAPAAQGETVNIGNESPEISIGELAQIVIDTVGEDVVLEALPETPGSPTRRCPSAKKLFDLTQYTGQVSITEGVAKTYDWYVKNVFANDGITAK